MPKTLCSRWTKWTRFVFYELLFPDSLRNESIFHFKRYFLLTTYQSILHKCKMFWKIKLNFSESLIQSNSKFVWLWSLLNSLVTSGDNGRSWRFFLIGIAPITDEILQNAMWYHWWNVHFNLLLIFDKYNKENDDINECIFLFLMLNLFHIS